MDIKEALLHVPTNSVLSTHYSDFSFYLLSKAAFNNMQGFLSDPQASHLKLELDKPLTTKDKVQFSIIYICGNTNE